MAGAHRAFRIRLHPIEKAGVTTRVDVITDSSALVRLRGEWTELLASSAADSPFLSWDWLTAWWRHLGGNRTLQVLTVRSADRLLGLVPLYRASSGIGMTRLEFLGTGTVSSDYLDVITRAGSEGEVLAELVRYLSQREDTIQFDHVRTPGSMSECLAARLEGDGWTTRSHSIGVCPLIRIGGHTWDSLLGTLGSSHRANVRRRIRALSAGYDMKFEMVTSEEQRRAVFPTLVALHNQRWGDRGGTAFHNEESRKFHDLATAQLLESGLLRLYVLTLNGAIAAVQYLLAYRGRFYFYQHGYDAQYSQHSVGLVSFALAIRSAIEEGASEFDMLWGDESYKGLWAHDSRSMVRLELYPPGSGGVIQRTATDANRALKSLAKRVLTSVPGKDRG